MRAKDKYPELFSDIVITPHVFRHTTATHMVASGVPLIVISRFLGHSDISTTLIYAQLSEQDVNEKLKNWDRAFWGEYIDEPLDIEPEMLNEKELNRSKIFTLN